ncbi:MAG: transcriptional regulator [Kofleriaceae bacterium]|nr:transcriptional regulator [Kofleriaceae bacterium]
MSRPVAMDAVERILQVGRVAHPEVTAPTSALDPLVRTRLADEEHPEQLAADEIFLACACAAADRAAITAFERRYFGAIPAALSRLSLGRDEIAEIEQILRVRLFVAEGSDLPRVVTYAGQGQLGGLLRVAAIRAGLNLLRERGRLDAEASDGLEDVPVTADDPELARLKAQHRSAFKAAFEQAVAALEPRERSVLNLALVKNLGIDKIGAIYGVHRATAARWVANARASLTRGVHKILGDTIGARGSDLENLLPLVESQLELSLERLLRTRGD